MKRFLDVEKTRQFYHSQKHVNSTHRASLLVPELPGTKANISFLNHFLIKRNYGSVACRVTAIDGRGRRIESRVVRIDEAKVYVIPLTGMSGHAAGSYMVEFFAADNLFIPFPAVMVNHVGQGFHNSVHAYNRVLNDVFEDDEINAVHQREAAIDVRLDRRAESFAVFHAGPQDLAGEIGFELRTPDGRVRSSDLAVALPKLGARVIRLGEVFRDLGDVSLGVLKIRQPKQFMFYGRMLVGQMARDGSLSANHSYYDCSDFPEYWPDARPSVRTYPYFRGIENIVRIYPIMSPGTLRFGVALYAADGTRLGGGDIGTVAAPHGDPLECRVARFAEGLGVDPDAVSAFQVAAVPLGGNTPTRVNHQLAYSAGGLEGSINISLTNPNVFLPPQKTGFSWGQILLCDGFESTLGITCAAMNEMPVEVDLDFYSEAGLIGRRRVVIRRGAAANLDVGSELAGKLPAGSGEEGVYVWYAARSARPDISAVVVTRNLATGNAVGEHSF
jgi:hypothetical protein